jgi:hypothetical protein
VVVEADRVDGLVDVVAVDPEHAGEEREVLGDGQVVVDAR